MPHPNTTYVLDSVIFIQAHRQYYGMDFCPGFWEALVHFRRTQNLLSIDKVHDELNKGKDQLTAWAKTTFDASAFDSTSTENTLTNFATLNNWVHQQPQFSTQAKNEFFSAADGWLVAYAIANNCTVVTHEVLNLEVKRKVPIPNICQVFNVPYTDCFTLLRNLSIQLTWTAPP